MLSRIEIADEITALATHFPKPRRTPDEAARWLEDYVDSLEPFGLDAVKVACIDWRGGDAVSMAKPGQLAALAKRIAERGKVKAENKPWKRISDEEYEALTLRDKARHHAILADCVVSERFGAIVRRVGSRDVAVLGRDPDYQNMLAAEQGHLAEARRIDDLIRASSEAV